jgi:hypothetical protein
MDSAGNLFVNTTSTGFFNMFEYNIWGSTPPFESPTLTNVNYFSSTGIYSRNASLGIDAYDNLYHSMNNSAAPEIAANCLIIGQNPAFGLNTGGDNWVLAGSRNCGFSGDGGLAAGAEISVSTGEFAFDAAGNFYFADSGNNRVRRIDEATGVIHTIAGNGVASYSGDGGPATGAAINAPTGIAVDSRGNLYATSLVPTGLIDHAVVRQIGPVGALSFPAQGIGKPSPVQTINVSNTGNNALNFTKINLAVGPNSNDFSIDPITTTCTFPSSLPAGQTCYIGVIFTPITTGVRSNVITISDNTVTGLNTIQLSGTGALPAQVNLSPPTLTFPTTTVGISSAAIPTTLSNPGGLPFTISSYSFTGTNPGDFTQTHTCGTTVAAGASCTLNVTFRPAGTGGRFATLNVFTSAGSGNVTLIGNNSAAIVPSKVTLASKANPAPVGKPIVLSSKVAGASTTIPTGEVQLRQGNTVLATATLAAGAATFKLSGLSAGSHSLIAVYLGDKTHATSESPAVKQVVAP